MLYQHCINIAGKNLCDRLFGGETFRDMMKGLDVPDSDYFNRTYEQYQQLTNKVKNVG
jgi:hypothetical protein